MSNNQQNFAVFFKNNNSYLMIPIKEKSWQDKYYLPRLSFIMNRLLLNYLTLNALLRLLYPFFVTLIITFVFFLSFGTFSENVFPFTIAFL